jgi:hypothetical protein
MQAMTPRELIALLHTQAKEIADAGHCGWGNTMTEAADQLAVMLYLHGEDKGTVTASTERAPCGCIVARGYRCQWHGDP